jgi:hypothetical protein
MVTDDRPAAIRLLLPPEPKGAAIRALLDLACAHRCLTFRRRPDGVCERL